ncbi:MAG: tetratricopeptide repeat protein [Silvanigrellaceae bacterium]
MMQSMGVSSVLFLALGAGIASASPGSLGGSGQNKLNSAPQQVQVKERTDNEVENKKKRGKSEREKREERGGGLNRSDYETAAIEKNLGAALDNEIRAMEPLVGRLPRKSEQRPEIMKRLIESLHQKATLTFFNETRTYDTAWKKWDEGGRRGIEPKFSMSVSKMWTSKVIQRCQQFITEYPEGRGIDEVYFQLAYAFDQLGQNKEAAQYYSRLVQKFPNSRRIADAHYALGEFYFAKLDFNKALVSFTEVVRFTRAAIRPYAEFKIGWCHYNLQAYGKALEKWKLVVNLANTSDTASKGTRVRLKDEAVRDMILAFVELKQVNPAMDYISKNASDKSVGDLYNKLSTLLQDKGEYDESVRVLKTFIARKPNDLRSAELQIQIVDTANLKNDKTLLWKEVMELNRAFGADSAWAKANAQSPDFKELNEKMHNVGYTYSKKMHFLGQKEKSAYYIEQAIKGYKIYLSAYGNRKEATEVRFLLGELQYMRDQYKDAEKTFAGFTSNKELKNSDPQRYEKAFEYQRTSAYFLVQKDMSAFRAVQFKPEQPSKPLSRELQDYVTVCDNYMAAFPKKPGTLDCQIDTAEIFLKTNNLPQAEKRLTVLAKERSNRKEGSLAAEFLLLMAKNDKKKLATVTNDLLTVPALANGEIGKRLVEIKRANRFDEVKDLETGGKFEQAAQEFERLGSDRSYSKADAAWFNAGVNYRKANKLDKSVQSYQRLISDFPKSTLIGDAMLEIIDLSAGRLQLQTAVNYVRMYLTRFPTSPKAAKLYAGACAYYEALSQAERAREVCPKVIAVGGAAAGAAAESLGSALERSGRYQEFIEFAEKTMVRLAGNASEKIEIYHRIEEAAKRMGNSAKAGAAVQQILSVYESNKKSVSGPALSFVAAIKFAREYPLLEKFRKEPLAAGKSGAELGQNIAKRNQALTALKEKFSAMAQSLGDAEWSVASLYVIGYAHELVAAELFNPPQPPGISGDAWQKVKAKFAEFGADFQKKGKDFYASAAVLVSKFGIYTEYGQKVIGAMARLEPTKFSKPDDWVPEAVFVGTEVMDVSKVRTALELKGE